MRRVVDGHHVLVLQATFDPLDVNSMHYSVRCIPVISKPAVLLTDVIPIELAKDHLHVVVCFTFGLLGLLGPSRSSDTGLRVNLCLIRCS